MVLRVWEVLEAFDPARMVYELVFYRSTTERERAMARNVTCLLLWLEMIVGVKVIGNVAMMATNSTSLSWVVDEAYAVHSYVLEGIYWLPPELEGLPTLVGLCGGGRLVDFRFFKFHKDLMARGLAMVNNTIAPLIFNESLYDMLLRFQEELEPEVNATLAPELLEMVVFQRSTPPEDARTVFISFPEGPPLSSQEILEYFQHRLCFGQCIERIAMEQPREWETHSPKHGVIVFRSAELRNDVMCNETAIFFRVNGRDMWVQLYQPLC